MKRWVGLSFLLGLGLVWTAAAVVPRPAGGSHGGPEYLNEDPASTAPFSDAVRVGSTLYLAGNLGLRTGSWWPGGSPPRPSRRWRT
jgi:hypothetical protein